MNEYCVCTVHTRQSTTHTMTQMKNIFGCMVHFSDIPYYACIFGIYLYVLVHELNVPIRRYERILCRCCFVCTVAMHMYEL